MDDLVKAVRAHALRHYNDGGWDVIEEAWDDQDIADCILRFNATTPDEAIQAVGQIVSIYADRQADARNSAF